MLCCKVCYCTQFWYVTRPPVHCTTTVKLLCSSELWRLFTFRQDCTQSLSLKSWLSRWWVRSFQHSWKDFLSPIHPQRILLFAGAISAFFLLCRQTTFAQLIPDHTGLWTPSSGIASAFRIAQYILWSFVHQLFWQLTANEYCFLTLLKYFFGHP